MYKTKLNTRTLWFDGESTVSEQELIRRLEKGQPISGLYVPEISPTIANYNKLVEQSDKIKTKYTLNVDLMSKAGFWNLPESYANINVEKMVYNYWFSECKLRGWIEDGKPPSIEATNRLDRVDYELFLYRSNELYDFLRALMYIINTLNTNNVVWGVGRGSSVSSYVLYLIGVHDVDSVDYELDISDFLHNQEKPNGKERS